jgi:hypothetical protein
MNAIPRDAPTHCESSLVHPIHPSTHLRPCSRSGHGARNHLPHSQCHFSDAARFTFPSVHSPSPSPSNSPFDPWGRGSPATLILHMLSTILRSRAPLRAFHTARVLRNQKWSQLTNILAGEISPPVQVKSINAHILYASPSPQDSHTVLLHLFPFPHYRHDKQSFGRCTCPSRLFVRNCRPCRPSSIEGDR